MSTKVTCSICQCKVLKKYAAEWVGHHMDGPEEYHCIPCIESKVRAAKFAAKHGYYPDSYKGLFGTSAGKRAEAAVFRRKDRALWVKRHKELGISAPAKNNPIFAAAKVLSQISRDADEKTNFPTGNGLSD